MCLFSTAFVFLSMSSTIGNGRNDGLAPAQTPKIINLADYSVSQLENLYQTMATVFGLDSGIRV